MVGRLAGEVLRGALRTGAVVGVGDGRRWATAAALEETATPVAVTVVPLCGGYWTTGPEREPYRRVAEALGGQARGLMAPGSWTTATQRALVAHAGVRAIVDLWDRVDVALFGIGGPA
jgi:DNA-binding transcriptional regulator LsrR (DeoR family)